MDTNKPLENETKLDLPLVQIPENQVFLNGRILGQTARESFTDYANPRAKEIAVYPGQDIQKALDILSTIGGGTLLLRSGTHFPPNTLTVSNNVSIIGEGINLTIMDFGNASNQLSIQGNTPYTTGSVLVTNNTSTMTGSSIVNWDISMVGQQILVEDFWYTIASIDSTASATLATPFLGSNQTNGTYVIATTLTNITLDSFTVQNSAIDAVYAQYVNGITLNNMFMAGSNVGFTGLNSSFMNFLNSAIDTCATGFSLTNFHYGTLFNTNFTNMTSGGASVMTSSRNWGFDVYSMQNITGTAIALRGVSNCGFVNSSMKQIVGAGIEFISNCTDISFVDSEISNASGDGIHFTDANLQNSIIGNSIINCSGWGINIANATNTDNIVDPNTFFNDTSGNLNDSGLRTVNPSNQRIGSFIEVNPFFTSDAQTNWTTIQADSNAIYNGAIQSSGAQNDEISWNVYMSAGTWSLSFMHIKSANRGIYTVSVGGSSLGTTDGYSAANSWNNIVTFTGITITTSGSKAVDFKMATKNAASAAYYGSIQYIRLTKTA